MKVSFSGGDEILVGFFSWNKGIKIRLKRAFLWPNPIQFVLKEATQKLHTITKKKAEV